MLYAADSAARLAGGCEPAVHASPPHVPYAVLTDGATWQESCPVRMRCPHHIFPAVVYHAPSAQVLLRLLCRAPRRMRAERTGATRGGESAASPPRVRPCQRTIVRLGMRCC